MIEPVASGSDVSVTTSSGENKPRPATFPDMGADTRVLPSRRPISKTQVDADLSLERSAPVANAEVDGPSRPTYRVRPYDTLRSIAKHTLGDARRDREILELNRDLIPDPRQLTPGQTLVLPEDATIASRVR
jgi:nucleoid-associated protein YgaU